VSLRRDRLDQPNVTVLRYANDGGAPTFLRSVVLERFDGETWKPREFAPDNAVAAADGAFPDSTLSEAISGTTQRYLITSDALVASWLPVPEHARTIEVTGDWFVDNVTGTVFSEAQTVRGQTWVVEALDATPTAQQLLAAPDISPEDQAKLSAATPVPESLATTARTVTAGSTTKYEAAVKIQEWLNTFEYSTAGVKRSQSATYLEQFLIDRKGYCEQFAATMALMSISLGIPSRVVVGFTSGSLRGPGEWAVSGRDAHAWPELFFTGVGWVRFEPTPSGTDATFVPPPWTAPVTTGPDGTPSRNPNDVVNPRQVPDALGRDRAGGDAGAAVAFEAFSPVDSADLWRKRALGVLALLALIAAAVPGAVRWRRRRRRMSGDVEDAWAELRDTMRDLGLPWSDADTPRQAAAGVVRSQRLAGEDAAAVARLGRAVERVRYAPNPPPAKDVRRDLEIVRAALLARVDRPGRVRAALLPPSLRTSTAPVN
jgi:hypothetical protein